MYRLIRWVGDPTPWRDPNIVADISNERIPQWAIDRFVEFDRHQRICALPGKSELTLGPSHGFSQTYVFGPKQFSVWMLEEDAKKLFDNEWDRWQFIDITETPSMTERMPLTKNQWKQLMASFSKLTKRRRLRPEFK